MPAYYDSMEMRRRHGIPPHALMAAYLEIVDTSRNVSKFWSCYIVSVSDLPDIAGQCRIHYYWGRIGTEGQRRSHGPMYRPAAIAKAHSMIESKLHKGYASERSDHRGFDHRDTLRTLSELESIDETVVSSHLAASGNETVHCQCGQPNCRPGPKKQRRKSKQRQVQADRFILLEDDDDA